MKIWWHCDIVLVSVVEIIDAFIVVDLLFCLVFVDGFAFAFIYIYIYFLYYDDYFFPGAPCVKQSKYFFLSKKLLFFQFVFWTRGNVLPVSSWADIIFFIFWAKWKIVIFTFGVAWNIFFFMFRTKFLFFTLFHTLKKKRFWFSFLILSPLPLRASVLMGVQMNK